MIEDIALSSGPDDPQNTEILSGEGGVVFEKAYISKGEVDYDVLNFMVSFVLFEDIYNNFLTGHMTLTDAASLITKINIYGAEFITVKYRTRQSNVVISKSFNITSVKDRGPTSTDREQSYTIHFTSLENVINNNITISTKLKGRTDDIVERIFRDNLRSHRIINGDEKSGDTQLIITGTPHSTSTAFIPSFWSPIKCINWVSSFIRGSRGSAPNFMFFETNKSFMFTSIEDLISIQRDQNSIFTTYIYSPSRYTIQDPTEFSYQFPEIIRGYSLVRKISAFDMFDTIEGQDRGLYGSTLQTFDLFFKEQRRFPYDHYKAYDKFNHMNDVVVSGGKMMSGKKKNTRPFGRGLFNGVDSKRIFRAKQYEVFPEVKDMKYQDWLSQRNSLLSQLSQQKIVIEVAGRSDVEVGKLVNFLYPKMQSDNKFTIDPYVSGIYMITAVKHGVTRDNYVMTLELTKDSMMEELV